MATKTAAPVSTSPKARTARKMAARRPVIRASAAKARSASARPAKRAFKVGELWDDTDTEFFKPYFEKLG